MTMLLEEIPWWGWGVVLVFIWFIGMYALVWAADRWGPEDEEQTIIRDPHKLYNPESRHGTQNES